MLNRLFSMTRASSPRLKPDERREQILGAARRVLEADPHRELTVDLVAVEAGVSPALLFHYFGSKKKFQYAVIEAAAAKVMLRIAPDLSLPPAEQLRSGIRALARSSPMIWSSMSSTTESVSLRGFRTNQRDERVSCGSPAGVPRENWAWATTSWLPIASS